MALFVRMATMTTPKITYAHLLTEPNPKHVESLIKFFESGCQQRGTGGFGVEIEHLPVHNSDDTAVTYYESNGIEALLNRIRPYYDENKEYWENGDWSDSPVTASPYLWNRADSWKRPSASCTSRRSSPHCTARSAAKSTPSSKNLVSDSSTMVTNRNPVTPTFPSIRRTDTRR